MAPDRIRDTGRLAVSGSAHAGKILEQAPEWAAQPVYGSVDHYDAEFVAEEFWLRRGALVMAVKGKAIQA
ncbi:MAG: hypothetical protein ABR534_16095 [Desulfotignum sp.]